MGSGVALVFFCFPSEDRFDLFDFGVSSGTSIQ